MSETESAYFDAATQRLHILALLQRNGQATSRELAEITPRYTFRINELRRDGHDIQTERLTTARKPTWVFTYHRDDLCRDDASE